MNKKNGILIGAVAIILLLVSTPLISALNTTPVTTQPTTISSTATAEQAIVKAKAIASTLLQEYGSDAGISTLCKRTNTVLSSTGSSGFCANLAQLIIDTYNKFDSLDAQLDEFREKIIDALLSGDLQLWLELKIEFNRVLRERDLTLKLWVGLVEIYNLLCFWYHPPDSTTANNAPSVACGCTQ